MSRYLFAHDKWRHDATTAQAWLCGASHPKLDKPSLTISTSVAAACRRLWLQMDAGRQDN